MVDGASLTSGDGVFFDGKTAARHKVAVTLGASSLRVEENGTVLTEWPYDAIEALDAPTAVMRLGRRSNPLLERLEIFDTAFAAAIDERAELIDRTGGLARRQQIRVVGWSFAACVSLVLLALFGVPALAERAAPLLPAGAERKLGAAVDIQVRAQLDNRSLGSGFECGLTDRERPGRAAFNKLVTRLTEAADLPLPLTIKVVRRSEVNAITLPGAHIYVFEGLINAAENPDQLAGVIGHEMGHVAHHDGTKAVLQAGGLSLLFGMLLGDFVGGGAVVLAAKTVLHSSFSRKQEAAADAFGAELMNKANGDAHALGALLAKVGGATEPGMKILLDHPETKARVAAIDRIALDGPHKPFVEPDEWADLRAICK